MNNELYHHGVKGQKWGVRTNRQSTSSGSKKTNIKRKSEEAKSNKPKATVRKTRKGMRVVAKHENIKVKVAISNITAISAGALRVAACFVPGGAALTTAANAATLINVATNLKT